MTENNEEACRKAFEAWAENTGNIYGHRPADHSEGRYDETQWEAWQAAWTHRTATREARGQEIVDFTADRIEFLLKNEMIRQGITLNSKINDLDFNSLSAATIAAFAPAKDTGPTEDLHQLIRVAITNPGDLRGFIEANYPAEFAQYGGGMPHEEMSEMRAVCWRVGFPKESGPYLVELTDGEMLVTFWNDGTGKNRDTWGDARRTGWSCLTDSRATVIRWIPTDEIRQHVTISEKE